MNPKTPGAADVQAHMGAALGGTEDADQATGIKGLVVVSRMGSSPS